MTGWCIQCYVQIMVTNLFFLCRRLWNMASGSLVSSIKKDCAVRWWEKPVNRELFLTRFSLHSMSWCWCWCHCLSQCRVGFIPLSFSAVVHALSNFSFRSLPCCCSSSTNCWCHLFLTGSCLSLLHKITRSIRVKSKGLKMALFLVLLILRIIIFVQQQQSVGAQLQLQSSSQKIQGELLPPRFTHVFPSDKVLDLGVRMSLKCEATGSPLPQITWTLDGSSLTEHSRLRVGDYVTNQGHVNSFVNLTSVRIEDGGIYSCTGKSLCWLDFEISHFYSLFLVFF